MATSRPSSAVLVLLAVLLAGCVGSAPAASSGPTPRAPAPSTTSGPPSAALTAEPTLEPPPAAILRAGPAQAVGRVGSYVWAGGSESAPWLPAAALDEVGAPAGGQAQIEIDGDVEVGSWTARAAPAPDDTGSSVTALGSGAGTPSFALPGKGAWVLAVGVVFAGGRGDATWYWHLVLN